MKELTLETLIAVFQEIFGSALFWAMVVVAIMITLAFIFVLIRDRSIEGRYLARAELSAPIGGIAAILFVQYMTNSGFSDIGGPIDLIVLLMTGVAGAGGLTFLAYVVQAFTRRRGEER
ncbi:DUF5368 domain-containing protein [Rhodovulum adriaticum]|uniref:Uncharacterized protein n=1 Tax=Rhodovulum adriaticum TaxID=35804 RepID=A0A4R2NL57_RHOAD|nr:DUF5368 domain-containing protein [Rhodovulum adriaticum]MBK1635496.1 hypothetical protein [Rhodovulum adriaticum]TCP22068.1 hypothetical protein EV656_108114 [Rhodovulum adriaticum]